MCAVLSLTYEPINSEKTTMKIFVFSVFNREVLSRDAATAYIAVTKNMVLKDFEPFEYDFYLTTDNSSEIRNNFNHIAFK